MQNLSIVYIGPKDQKKDTVAATGRVFKRLVPMLVPYEPALTMLLHPTVWIEAKDLTDSVKSESEHLVEKMTELNEKKDLAASEIDTSKLGGSEKDDDLKTELEELTTKAALDEWMKDCDINLEFERDDTMTYRREKIIEEVARLQAQD